MLNVYILFTKASQYIQQMKSYSSWFKTWLWEENKKYGCESSRKKVGEDEGRGVSRPKHNVVLTDHHRWDLGSSACISPTFLAGVMTAKMLFSKEG